MSNYFCTWSVQNYQYGCGADRLDPAELEGARGAAHARESMNQPRILGPDGWARRIPTRAGDCTSCWTTAGTCPIPRTTRGSAR